jgi:23S rRNA pseudouridine2605 synthase
VSVNGQTELPMGTRVHPERDVIRVDGERIMPPSEHVYLIANKPRGVVSSMADEKGRPDLRTLISGRPVPRREGQSSQREVPPRLFHVGRLDTDTSGLLILTNDGELAHRLAHPSFEVTKTYVALVKGAVADSVGAVLKAGIELEDGPAAVDRFRVRDRSSGRSLVELDVHIGRNRIVRRMLDQVGHPVLELTRTAFGPIRLGGLNVGALRELTSSEVGALFDTVEE